MSIVDLNLALTDGARLTVGSAEDSNQVDIEYRRISEIFLPTGTLVACDPFYAFQSLETFRDAMQFERSVTPATFGFDISIGHFPPRDPREHSSIVGYPPEFLERLFPEDLQALRDQRTLLAVIRFGTATPVRWRMATGNQNESVIELRGRYGFGVDSGIAAFMDASAAAKLLVSSERHKERFDVVVKSLQAALSESNAPTRSWASVSIEPGLNMVAVSTGFGSGFFDAYWGFDAQGDLTCLAANFGVLNLDA